MAFVMGFGCTVTQSPIIMFHPLYGRRWRAVRAKV